MKAEILSIGTELLLGDIVNTNAQYIAKELASLGISLYYQTVVGDNPERLENAMKEAFKRADILITTGGLGPTADDMTKEIAAKLFGKKLILDENALGDLKNYFAIRDVEMSENNLKQVYKIEDSIFLKNNNGTAAGTYYEDEKTGKILVLLPGPPREMTGMFENELLTILKEKQKGTYLSKVIKTSGIGESSLEDKIKYMINEQENPSIATYAKEDGVSIRITAAAENEAKAEKLIDPILTRLNELLGDLVVGDENSSVEKCIYTLLKENNLSLTTVESASGGKIAERLVSQEGISDVFLEGFITYNTSAKTKRLGIAKDFIEKYGVVSQEVAEEMAKNASKISGADVSLSLTGYASKTPEIKDDDLGLVYISVSIKGELKSIKVQYRASREKIRTNATNAALEFLRTCLIDYSRKKARG